MGPLFSGVIFVLGLALIWAVAFVGTRFFQPVGVAIRLAALFTIGAVTGAILIALVITLFIGVGGALTSPWQVIAYLSSLAVGGLTGGGLVLWIYIKYRILTLRSSGTSPLRDSAP